MDKHMTVPAGVIAIALALQAAPMVLSHPASAQNPVITNAISRTFVALLSSRVTSSSIPSPAPGAK